jgi:hypothetical protein
VKSMSVSVRYVPKPSRSSRSGRIEPVWRTAQTFAWILTFPDRLGPSETAARDRDVFSHDREEYAAIAPTKLSWSRRA